MKMNFLFLVLFFPVLAFSSGLKSKDYKEKSTGTETAVPETQTPSISPEQMQELMGTLQKAKASQEQQNETLKQLDEEEDEN